MLSSSELSKMIVDALSDGYDDEENKEEEERNLYGEISCLPGDSFIRAALERLCERVEDLEFVERKSNMKKFKVNYTEVFARSFIVEAGSEEEAMEKMQYAAEYIGGLVDVDHFNHWDLEVERVATENDIKMYDKLPEE